MAENSNVIYIPYGLDEIDLAALNEALANEYLNYLNSRVWTRGKKGQKRAQKWIDFHNKVSHQGITGASIVDGLWGINYNGQDFIYADPDEKQIAEDYASFVIDQMKKLPTRKSKEDKKEDKKDKYDFRSNFRQDFLNRYYGNNPDLYKAEWFELDPRGEKGIRGTEKRRERLIEALTKYRDESLKDNYDYEGTPFTGYDDVKSRITEAINALQSPNANDDLPALNKLGLDYRSMMYNGANDVYGKDTNGNSVTYLQYYDNLDKIAKQEAEAKATSAKKAAETARANYWDGFKSYDFSKFHGRPLKSEESNIEHLSNLFAKDKWSGDEASLIVQAFKLAELNGKLVPLSKEELSKLNPSIWKNRAKYLRKIDGVDGLYYDTYSRLYKKFYKNGQDSQTSFLDILNLNNPEAIAKKKADSDLKLREQYAKRTEMTPQDWEYVASIVPDIASIPDTEPISAAALAFTGAGMRHHALANRPGGMSASDKWWLAADYLGAGLAAIPGFGDAYLVGRILNTTRKFATGLFAAAGAYGLGSATVNAFGKWAKGEDMTLQEKMDVVMAIPSLVSAYRLRSREGLNDAAKAANLNNITTNKGKVKVTVTDESGNKSIKEITGLSEQKSKELLKQFKNAGNDNSKKTQILKSDSEVQTRASELGIDLNKVSIETDSRHAASYRKPTEIEFYPETSPSSARTRYNQEIENLKNSGHNWQARRLLIYDKFYKGTGGAKKLSDGNWFKKAWHYVTDTPNLELANRIKNGETPEVKSAETPKTTETKSSTKTPYKPLVENSPLKPQPKGESSELFNIQRPIKEPKSTPNYGKKDLNEVQKSIENIRKFRESYGFDGTRKPMAKGFDGETIKEGFLSFEFGGEKITLKVSKSDLKGVDRKHANFNSHVVDIRNRIAKQIEEFSKKHSVEETSKLIEGSLKKGWLKQGGRLDKQKIQKYKEFIKK